MSNSSPWFIDKTPSGATTLGKSGLGCNDNEGELSIIQISSITGASLSNCLMSYPGHLSGSESYPLCRDAVSIFYSPSQLGYFNLGMAVSLGGRKHRSKTNCTSLKNWPLVTSSLWQKLWVKLCKKKQTMI